MGKQRKANSLPAGLHEREGTVSPKDVVVRAANGKLVYWVLSVVLALASYFGNSVLTQIFDRIDSIDAKVDGIDVLENRVKQLETYHDRGSE